MQAYRNMQRLVTLNDTHREKLIPLNFDYRVHMFYETGRKQMLAYASFYKFYSKMTLGFHLDREKRFFLEVLFYIQQKDPGFL